MKLALIIVGSLVAVLVLVVAIAAIAGSMLPKGHEASRSAVVNAPPAEVYRLLTDYASAPNWRTGLQRVELLGEVEGRTRFREHGEHGVVTYEVKQQEPARLLVTEIVDKDLGYSGSWTYALAPEGAGTRVTITERGEVPNVLFRFMSRYVFGHTKTMDSYLAALTAKLSSAG